MADCDGDPGAGDEPLLQDVNPFWLILFWLPAVFWLFYSGVLALWILGPDWGWSTELWGVIALGIPVISLLRVPLLLDRPPRRFPAVDLTLSIWGMVGVGWLVRAEGWFLPLGLMFLLYAAAFLIAGRAYAAANNRRPR